MTVLCVFSATRYYKSTTVARVHEHYPNCIIALTLPHKCVCECYWNKVSVQGPPGDTQWSYSILRLWLTGSTACQKKTHNYSIWFKKSTPWKRKLGLEPVSESWIFQNFETRDTKNRKFHKFKKSVSSVFSLKRMKKNQKSWFFVFLIDFRGRSPGHLRWIQKTKNTPRACSIASQLEKSMKFHVRVNQFS